MLNIKGSIKLFNLYMAAAALAHGGEQVFAISIVKKRPKKSQKSEKNWPPFPPGNFLFLLAT